MNNIPLMVMHNPKIFVAGHSGMVGSAIVRYLTKKRYHNIIVRSRAELDLRNQSAVTEFFKTQKPDWVFLAAAKVGGIYANKTYPAPFIQENLSIQLNVIDAAWQAGVQHLCFLGSSCIYPKECPQPIREESLLTGSLESTNEAYAVAKIAGIKMCQSYNRQYGTRYITVLPTNLYGPQDSYDLETCHVLPALLRKIHLIKLRLEGNVAGLNRNEQCYGKLPNNFLNHLGCIRSESDQIEIIPDRPAPEHLPVWGSGRPKRELLYVDDLAEACVRLMEARHPEDVFNAGIGSDLTIAEIAHAIQQTLCTNLELKFDPSQPDGTMKKLLNSSRIRQIGWRPTVDLSRGLKQTYADYLLRQQTILS